MDVAWINFSVKTDARGMLVPIEAGRDIPFEIKRVYAVLNLAEGQVRGLHAHKSLRQVIVALAGRCQLTLDNGEVSKTVELSDPARGVLIEPMIWHEMADFSPGCVLMVLAADHYDEADYIRDRALFLELTRLAV
jgi:dTDP-4-dehydrorhamnose 3,5-epimerase-like enzyme